MKSERTRRQLTSASFSSSSAASAWSPLPCVDGESEKGDYSSLPLSAGSSGGLVVEF